MAICTWKNNCILLSLIISDFEKTQIVQTRKVEDFDGYVTCKNSFLTVCIDTGYGIDTLKM